MRGKIGNTVSIGKGLANMYSSLTRACISICCCSRRTLVKQSPPKSLSSANSSANTVARFLVAATIDVEGSNMFVSKYEGNMVILHATSVDITNTSGKLSDCSVSALRCTGKGHSAMQKKAGCPFSDKQVHV